MSTGDLWWPSTVVTHIAYSLYLHVFMYALNRVMYSKPSFYNGDSELPVYQWNESNQHYTLDSLAGILLDDQVPTAKICSKQPVHVCHNASFVVDLHKLDDPVDVRADENGVWMRKGSPVAYLSKHTKERTTRFFRRTNKPTQPHQFKITRTYYRHASSSDFTRMISVAHGECIVMCVHVCIVTGM